MTELLDLLLHLNRVDKALITLKRRLDAAKEELVLRDRELAAAEARRQTAEDAIRRAALDLDRVQLETRADQAEFADQDRKLKAVKNNTEYEIVTDRIKELRHRIDDNETAMLQGMDALDAAKAALAGAQAQVDAARAARAAQVEKNESDVRAIRAEQSTLKEKRELWIEKIRVADESAYALYNDALRRTKGDALAKFAEGVCQSCYMQQSPSVASAVMVGRELRTMRCGGCGRILVATEES